MVELTTVEYFSIYSVLYTLKLSLLAEFLVAIDDVSLVGVAAWAWLAGARGGVDLLAVIFLLYSSNDLPQYHNT